jgi:proline dehydrogenase
LQPFSPDFNNTEVAFAGKSANDLNRAYWLFKIISYNWLVKVSPPFVNTAIALHLPIKGIIKSTIFKQFCGGEDITDCNKTILQLAKYNIGTILDYSVEGKENEAEYDATLNETLAALNRAKGDPAIPFGVFKVTGVASFELLEKISCGASLTNNEAMAWEKVKQRVDTIGNAAAINNVPVFVDAEESWIQVAIDSLAIDLMKKYNKEKAIVYNTYQLYRHDKLEQLKNEISTSKAQGYFLGAKLVRGAYMEKERKRASSKNEFSPIQKDKLASDHDYDAAIQLCLDHLDQVAICAGTHNEKSSLLLANEMIKRKINPDDKRIFFSQLYGMSDHISYNLAALGYNVAKYVPYGPVTAVLPYLIRRAQENTSVKGQTGRELSLIMAERRRRKKA